MLRHSWKLERPLHQTSIPVCGFLSPYIMWFYQLVETFASEICNSLTTNFALISVVSPSSTTFLWLSLLSYKDYNRVKGSFEGHASTRVPLFRGSSMIEGSFEGHASTCVPLFGCSSRIEGSRKDHAPTCQGRVEGAHKGHAITHSSRVKGSHKGHALVHSSRVEGSRNDHAPIRPLFWCFTT